MKTPNKNFDVFGSTKDSLIKTAITSIKIEGQRDEIFMKILSSIDFRDCKNDMAALRKFWHVIWPHFSEVISANEILLEEQAKTLRTYGQLVEDFKLLEVKYAELEATIGEGLQEESKESIGQDTQV